MIKRRALIVDDSRSARQILGRMLESFGMEVDAVESAELALSYLQTARPDVIFMDHLMSGMDGFAAVRVLKANPDTATIPVLMYTSQEGEVYLSQARALGAVGVLPKTLKHSDVANALQQLRLLGDSVATPTAAQNATSSPRPVATTAAAGGGATEDRMAQPRGSRVPQSDLVADLTVQQLSQRIANELKAELITHALQTQPVRRSVLGFVVSTGMTACLLLLGVGTLIYWQYQTQQQLAQMQASERQLLSLVQTQATALRGALPALPASSINPTPVAPPATATKTPAALRAESETVEYGEVPLSMARLERLRSLVDALRAQGFKGTLRVEVFTGDFCLQGNAGDGYHVADDDVAIKRCDLLGNPFADALSAPQRQSVAFANYVASINNGASAVNMGIHIQLLDGGRQLAVPYPPQSATLTAGEWNRSALRNHRVEFTAVAAANNE